MARLRAGLATLLAPPQCVLCDAPGLPGPIDLCAGCLAALPRNSVGLQRAPGWNAMYPLPQWVVPVPLRPLRLREQAQRRDLIQTT